MADYWKSNPRKYCDFCKCWFADNKSSIEFHERGKRHQEAVRLRLGELAKKGREDFQQQQRLESEMERIEQAALAAFKKDLRDDPALARQYGVRVKSDSPAADPASSQGPVYGPSLDGAPVPSEAATEPPTRRWQEAKSDQGYTYYWNIDTGESRWEPPDEGYVPLAETTSTSTDAGSKDQTANARLGSDDQKGSSGDQPGSPVDRESRESPPGVDRESMGPANRPDPYGSRWETVQREPVGETVDLQLPEQRAVRQHAAAATYKEKPKIVFKQKAISSLGVGEEAFKKRKVDGETKRNIRQRTDED